MTEKKSSDGVELQERDYTLLTGLFESRVMLRSHLIALYFPDRPEYGKKRIQRLVEGNFITERKPKANQGRFLPSFLYLTRQGLAALEGKSALVESHGLSWEELVQRIDVAASTLHHELEIIDLKVAFTKTLQTHPAFSLVEFATWPRLYEFTTEHLETGRRITLKPDAYIEIHETDADEIAEHRFFLEHDRSSEARQRLAVKAHGYAHYYRTGGLAIRCGLDPAGYKEVPFRVLVTLLNVERRNNVAERLIKEPQLLKQQFLLTTFEEVMRDPLGAVWISLKDYAQATAETMYDPKIYTADRRVSARDRLVAERLTKRSLFAN
jgi:hypothetical protein